MARYRCFITKREEETLPIIVQKELKYLRRRCKEAEDWALYNLYVRMGDPLPVRLDKKYSRMEMVDSDE